MSRETSYLKLHLPDENEFYDVEKDQNKNFEKLDKKIEELDTFEKNSGYNLNKTDSYSDNDTNKLATAKALYEAYKNSAHVFESLDFKGFHYNSESDLYYFINNNTHRRIIDNRGGNVEKLSVNGNNVWHTGNFDPDNKIGFFGGYKFKGLHFNEQKDLYYFINDTESRRIIDNRGGDVERLTISGNNVWHTGNFDPSIKINKFGGLDFKGFHYNSESDLYYFINDTESRRIIDNRGGDVEKLSVNGNNVWHTGNFDPDNKIGFFGGLKFKGFHYNSKSDLYYFIDDRNSRRIIDNRGGDVEKLTINGAKIYHTENFIRHIWNGAYLASLNETSPFCNLPADWRICIIGYQWVSGSNLGSTFATAVILRNHVPLNRWFLAHSGNPNNQPNLMWGEARFMITSSNGLISQGQNTYGGDCYVLTVDVI